LVFYIKFIRDNTNYKGYCKNNNVKHTVGGVAERVLMLGTLFESCNKFFFFETYIHTFYARCKTNLYITLYTVSFQTSLCTYARQCCVQQYTLIPDGRWITVLSCTVFFAYVVVIMRCSVYCIMVLCGGYYQLG
jgi:hypothetical protein